MAGPRYMSLVRVLLLLCLVLACTCLHIGPLLAQDPKNEYGTPALDPEHDFGGTLPEEYIDLFSGAVTLRYVDISLPGTNGLDLSIVRWYNSKVKAYDNNNLPSFREFTSYGLGWQMHMGRLDTFPQAPSNQSLDYVLELPGGLSEGFYSDRFEAGVFRSKDFWRLEKNIGANQYEVISPAGLTYIFPDDQAHRMDPDNQYLYVSEIRDTAGNMITVTYEAAQKPYLNVITDTVGRTVRFVYDHAVHSTVSDEPDRLKRIEVTNFSGGTSYYLYTIQYCHEISACNTGVPGSRLLKFEPPSSPDDRSTT